MLLVSSVAQANTTTKPSDAKVEFCLKVENLAHSLMMMRQAELPYEEAVIGMESDITIGLLDTAFLSPIMRTESGKEEICEVFAADVFQVCLTGETK